MKVPTGFCVIYPIFDVLFFIYVIQHCFICRPSDSTVSEDAGIEPDALTTWLDLIHHLLTKVRNDLAHLTL